MYLGIDIGGSKTLLALFNDNGRIIRKLKFKTPQDPKIFYLSLRKNLIIFFKKSLFKKPTLKNVVVAVAGTVDSSFKVSDFTHGKPLTYGNLPWKKFKFSEAVEDCINNLFNQKLILNMCPIYIQNDANLGVFYEGRTKNGKTIYLTFSTGIGGGIVKDGKLTKSSDVFEPGHWKYYWKSHKLEYEDIASAKAIETAYGNKKVATSLRGKIIHQDIALRMSTGLSDIIKQEKPDYIIIGGALGKQLKHVKPYLITILSASLGHQKLPDISAAKYPLESTIHGCFFYGKSK